MSTNTLDCYLSGNISKYVTGMQIGHIEGTLLPALRWELAQLYIQEGYVSAAPFTQ